MGGCCFRCFCRPFYWFCGWGTLTDLPVTLRTYDSNDHERSPFLEDLEQDVATPRPLTNQELEAMVHQQVQKLSQRLAELESEIREDEKECQRLGDDMENEIESHSINTSPPRSITDQDFDTDSNAEDESSDDNYEEGVELEDQSESKSNGYVSLEIHSLSTPKRKRKGREIGRAVQQECRDRSRMPSSA
eukprot:TRINITY_DN10924_c0_g1_i1.p1 TRINITY_DN10924_c0_g1~~TRINITY_DN10924_c0_g1_i1.p1  ORF type:complete len:190 (-),score=18.88 TRINITY_DN10924_c0_g1_i1:10-579(-)